MPLLQLISHSTEHSLYRGTASNVDDSIRPVFLSNLPKFSTDERSRCWLAIGRYSLQRLVVVVERTALFPLMTPCSLSTRSFPWFFLFMFVEFVVLEAVCGCPPSPYIEYTMTARRIQILGVNRPDLGYFDTTTSIQQCREVVVSQQVKKKQTNQRTDSRPRPERNTGTHILSWLSTLTLLLSARN